VLTNLAAVHAGETLIKRPPAAKVVQTNTAAVHAGATLIKWPPPARVVRSNMAAVHAGETLIKRPTSIPIPKQRIAPPSAVVNTSTGAIAPSEAKVANNAPKDAIPQSSRIKRQSADKTVTGKRRSRHAARTVTGSSQQEDRRRLRMANSESPRVKVQSRRTQAADSNEKRAVGQLNDDDRRAFWSRCGKILSAPGKYARAYVGTCIAAGL
jgi:hypothetical protein